MTQKMNERIIRIMRSETLLRDVCEEALEEYAAGCGSSEAAATSLNKQYLFIDKIVEADSDGDMEVDWGILIASDDNPDYTMRITIADEPGLFDLLSKCLQAPEDLSGLVEYVAGLWDDEEHFKIFCESRVEEQLDDCV
ncbi:hypothetical protein [Antarcticimicrobium sediminis]|uniref:Uncharacterized protein n=1 Tax=Antarcticimicrobium sediminis TaxID=2546227 RepID=A0A4R5EJC7_9RHOB|nr:hypothetical protein [Antarcticimicrobium sediminis]TDE34639.1 hypothetical protein E1B25_19065 [Antarcticimicrobium sediminis]